MFNKKKTSVALCFVYMFAVAIIYVGYLNIPQLCCPIAGLFGEKGSEKQNITIIYWSDIRGRQFRLYNSKDYFARERAWPFTFVGDDCPVACTLTDDKSKMKDADLIVFHSDSGVDGDLPDDSVPWMLQGNENPISVPELNNATAMKRFTYSMSYRLDSDFPTPIAWEPTNSTPLPFHIKSPAPLSVSTYCEPVRTKYQKELMKYIEVHSYGKCLRNKDTLIDRYEKKDGLYSFKEEKLNLTRYYRFSLVFFKQDCDYFVDDRLYHALEAGSVPIVMATEKIYDFLPGNLRHSIIDVRDFKSPSKLAEYITYLNNNETAYQEYLKWKYVGIGDVYNTTIGQWWRHKYPVFCQVCMRLASKGKGSKKRLKADGCQRRQFNDWNLNGSRL